MRRAKTQLYVLCDMEGASQISPENRKAMHYGSDLWKEEGRSFITSDVRAVCEAASAFGVDEIILNDSHDYGHKEPNVLTRELPANVQLVRRPYLPGKPRHLVNGDLIGIVFVGMHARYAGGGFAPHTISAPFGDLTINGIQVGEIGLELALFMGAPLLAVAGEQAAVEEAKALCPAAAGIAVKSLEKEWFPPATQTYPLIRDGIRTALQQKRDATGLQLKPPFRFTLKPADGFCFDPDKKSALRWLSKRILFGLSKGQLNESQATWETPGIIRGLYALHSAQAFLTRSS